MRERASTSASTASWPPLDPNETEDERTRRLAVEAEAKTVSDAIDAGLVEERDRVREQRRATGARILLLGQAESGKSTVLKNFQLHFAPNAFQAEAAMWRPIVHLNLLRSINLILEIVVARLDAQAAASSDHSEAGSSTGHSRADSTANLDIVRRLRYSLMPLKTTEEALSKRTGITSDQSGAAAESMRAPTSSTTGRRKSLFRLRKDEHNPVRNEREKKEDYADRRIISACAEDMIKLWENPDVQRWLEQEEINLFDKPGFFLDSISRIADEDYIPTSSDILRARLPTVGPEEHHIPIESTNTFDEMVGSESGKEWIMYDVGGSRTQRAAWAQYFDDVTAIIFMAPISAFNQSLEEDPSINRLADSMKLWRSICSNKLLQDVHLVLFLNKTDLLDMQLRNGVQFSKWVPSFKDRPNDMQNVTNYLIEVFHGLHSQYSPKRRKVFAYLTCATDTQATSRVIARIQEAILVQSLSETNIL